MTGSASASASTSTHAVPMTVDTKRPTSAAVYPARGQETSDLSTPQHSSYCTYSLVMWMLYLSITTLAILDRFTTNVWPRQNCRIGKGTCGNDSAMSFDNPWTVIFYEFVARVAGRVMIVSLNFQFITMMKRSFQWLQDKTMKNRCIDMSNVRGENVWFHIVNGCVLIVSTLLHIWSILFPVFFSGFDVQVRAGEFEWPVSERKPAGFKHVDVNATMVTLQVDDAARLGVISVLFAVLVPISLQWMGNHMWHIGELLHIFVAVVYFFDIVRRHTHPRSWIFNTPFFLAWLFDLVVLSRCMRREVQLNIRSIGRQYAVMLWKEDSRGKNMRESPIAEHVYLKLRSAAVLEKAHPFTTFKRRGTRFLGTDWDVGVIVRLYNHRRLLPGTGGLSHTARFVLGEEAVQTVYRWPLSHGDISRTFARLHHQDKVALVASGSALGFLLDGIQDRRGHGITRVLFTCRCKDLITWASDSLGRLTAASSSKPTFYFGYTGVESISDEDIAIGTLCRGRLDFDTLLAGGDIDVVICVGSAPLQKAVWKMCTARRIRILISRHTSIPRMMC